MDFSTTSIVYVYIGLCTLAMSVVQIKMHCGRMTRKVLLGEDGTGYPGLDGFELGITPRTAEPTDDDDEVGKPHGQHERQDGVDREDTRSQRLLVRRRPVRCPCGRSLFLGTGSGRDLVEEILVEEIRPSGFIQKRLY